MEGDFMLKVKAREVDKGVENSLFYQVKVKKNFDAPCGYFKSHLEMSRLDMPCV
jgi:hypothetical protein